MKVNRYIVVLFLAIVFFSVCLLKFVRIGLEDITQWCGAAICLGAVVICSLLLRAILKEVIDDDM